MYVSLSNWIELTTKIDTWNRRKISLIMVGVSWSPEKSRKSCHRVIVKTENNSAAPSCDCTHAKFTYVPTRAKLLGSLSNKLTSQTTQYLLYTNCFETFINWETIWRLASKFFNFCLYLLCLTEKYEKIGTDKYRNKCAKHIIKMSNK